VSVCVCWGGFSSGLPRAMLTALWTLAGTVVISNSRYGNTDYSDWLSFGSLGCTPRTVGATGFFLPFFS